LRLAPQLRFLVQIEQLQRPCGLEVDVRLEADAAAMALP
jgi:hypothetical protein